MPELAIVCGGQTRLQPSSTARESCRRRLSPGRAVSSPASPCRPFRIASRGSAVLFSIVAAVAALPAVGAGLAVAHDAGGGVPVAPYMAAVLAPGDDLQQGAGVAFPIRTPVLKRGALRGERRLPDAQWLTQPLFLVGSDTASRRWLTQHRAELLRLHAVGVVVQAPSRDAYERLRRAADGLSLAPVGVPWLAARLRTLDAAVYPLLILADGRIVQKPPKGGLQ
jgi:integrating conjugative element protein (TIGR03765 family)